MFKRTGKIQAEQTATGIITTAEERNSKTRSTRWVQIGYVSTRLNDDGKIIADGPFGKALL